jgi:hypothetical protein
VADLLVLDLLQVAHNVATKGISENNVLACPYWCKLKAVLEVADVAKEIVEDVA